MNFDEKLGIFFPQMISQIKIAPRFGVLSYFWVFSELYAATTTLWLKTYVSPDVSLVNAGAEGGYEPVGREMSLPDVFVEVNCP